VVKYPSNERKEMAVRKIGKNWYVDIYDRGKRIVKAIGVSKKLAEQVERKWKLEIAEGKFNIHTVESTVPFSVLAKRYIDFAKLNKKSWKRDVTSLKNILPFFGNRKLNEISPYFIEEYKQARSSKVTPATVNRELALMKYMFNLAIKWEETTSNPVRKTKFFMEKNKRLRFLDEDEINRLIDCCPPQLKPVVITALDTGMRKSEILGLRWNDIDFERNLIYLDDSKSGSPRQIPIGDFLKGTLLKLKQQATSDVVFLNKHGKPYRDVLPAFKRALKKAGICDFRFHDLRHTFASHLAMINTPLHTIGKLLGQKTLRMADRYAHLSEEYKFQAVNRLQRRIHGSQNIVKKESAKKLP
jgi:integrase